MTNKKTEGVEVIMNKKMTAIPAETARPRLTKVDAGEYRLGPYRISRRWQSGRACPTPFGNRSWWCVTRGDDFVANEPTLARVRERLAR